MYRISYIFMHTHLHTFNLQCETVNLWPRRVRCLKSVWCIKAKQKYSIPSYDVGLCVTQIAYAHSEKWQDSNSATSFWTFW